MRVFTIKLIRALQDIFSVRKIIHKTVRQERLIDKYERLSLYSEVIGTSSESICDKNVVISLTSYGSRVHEAYLTIETLFHQTVKPNKIILWLAHDEYSEKQIPQSLRRLQKRGLCIKFCKDLRSYKKLIPCLKEYPDDIIITVDDDYFYPQDFVEYIIESYKKDNSKIYFYRGHRININENNEIKPYKNWTLGIEDEDCSILNFPVGCGGVLYPPGALHKDVLREELFMELCPNADDVWFKAMAILQGTKSQKVSYYTTFYQKFTTNIEAQATALFKQNYLNNENDIQLKRVLEHYKIKLKQN